MDSIIGLVVIVYLIASVVGAVVERLRRGSLPRDASPMPAGEVQRPRVEPEERGGVPEVQETGTPPEPSPMAPTAAKPVDPRPVASREAGEMAWGMIQKLETATRQKTLPDPAQDRRSAHSPQRPVQDGWRRAVVMMEIMDKPRGLRPYRPPWLG
ncbi:MAG: hypothetical protein GX855_06895 [Firmicutes bacterium]|nr:hypothetical protein [Bacillota bacterium]